MSHFTVAVITPDPDNLLEDLMAPYQENNMGTCPREYLEFNDIEPEERKNYEEEGTEKIRFANGETIWPWEYKGDRENLSEGDELVSLSFKELYPTFDEYMEDYVSAEKDEETGKYGYWENPNRKWDWYCEGGRWEDLLILKDGTRANRAKIKDIFFAEDPHNQVDGQVQVPQDDIEQILGQEPVVIQTHYPVGPFLVPSALVEEVQKNLAEAEEMWDEVASGRGFYRPEYMVQRYGSKENYVKESLQFGTYAVITPDGKWHSKGEMGWFGISSESDEESAEFNNSYFDTFIKTADPEHYLVVIDCHI